MEQSQVLARISMFILLLIIAAFNKAEANMLGLTYQGFNPDPLTTDYLSVHSASTLKPKKWRFYFFGNASGNNFLTFDTVVNQNRSRVTDEWLSGDFGFSYSFTPQIELGFGLPITFKQTVHPQDQNKYTTHSGLNSIRTMAKYVVKSKLEAATDEFGMALVGSMDMPNIDEDGFLGAHPSPIFNFELVFDRGSDAESQAFNVGYRIRQPGPLYPRAPILPLDDQLIASAAIQKQIKSKKQWTWIGEISGAYPLSNSDYKNRTDISSLELFAGLKGGASQSQRWIVGGGVGVLRGSLNPDWRLVAGWTWDFSWIVHKVFKDVIIENRSVRHHDFSPLDSSVLESVSLPAEDSDRDGVDDDTDMCPQTKRGFKVDSEGCPFDHDNDTIPDEDDRCPQTPEGEVVNAKGCTVIK